MPERPTIKALHESLRNDPMALVMGPAIQAGLSLSARLARDYPEFWAQMADELLEQARSVEGLNDAENEVADEIMKIYNEQQKGVDGGSRSK